jgi:transcriptional regulator with XRE-family HTH domain
MIHPKLPTWDEWFDSATGGETQGQIADRLGVSRATLGRWLHRGVLDPNTVLAVARAYSADPIQGLLAAKWLTPADLHNGGTAYVVSYATTRMLVNELHRRLGSVAEERR